MQWKSCTVTEAIGIVISIVPPTSFSNIKTESRIFCNWASNPAINYTEFMMKSHRQKKTNKIQQWKWLLISQTYFQTFVGKRIKKKKLALLNGQKSEDSAAEKYHTPNKTGCLSLKRWNFRKIKWDYTQKFGSKNSEAINN